MAIRTLLTEWLMGGLPSGQTLQPPNGSDQQCAKAQAWRLLKDLTEWQKGCLNSGQQPEGDSRHARAESDLVAAYLIYRAECAHHGKMVSTHATAQNSLRATTKRFYDEW